MPNDFTNAISVNGEVIISKSMADVVYENSGRRICADMPLADLTEAFARADKVMQEGLSKAMFPNGREQYVTDLMQDLDHNLPEARISRFNLERIRDDHPKTLYALIRDAGVKLAPFQSMGLLQPLHDWVEHDLPHLIEKLYKIYTDFYTDTIVISQDAPNG